MLTFPASLSSCIKTILRIAEQRSVRGVSDLIKTITKFSNVIGYQQPDLSINWTVAHVMLVIGQYASFCVHRYGTLLSKLLSFSAFITTF